MNTPPSDGIAAFGNLSSVVDVDVFADGTIDLAPTAMPLPSQLTNTEDRIVVSAAGSLGSPAAGSLHRPGSDSDRLTNSGRYKLLFALVMKRTIGRFHPYTGIRNIVSHYYGISIGFVSCSTVQHSIVYSIVGEVQCISLPTCHFVKGFRNASEDVEFTCNILHKQRTMQTIKGL